MGPRLAAGVLALAGFVITSSAAPVGAVAGPPSRGFSAMLAAPGAGDLSYGVAEVRIVPDAKRAAVTALGARIFVQRVGGLVIVARSREWNRLARSSRVFVVVSKVAGADPSVREVAFFVIRRRLGRRPADSARGSVLFSIADARASQHSFWVRGVDRRGFAEIFQVRDMLATAVGNWSRYLAALRAARALAAAMHPLDRVAALPIGAHAARVRRPGRVLWTGGQRPDDRVRAMFRLLADAVTDPVQYAQAKRNSLVTDFIVRELNNPVLARRWRAVTVVLPLRVPDRYAAAAREEALFTHVSSPRITPARVTIADSTNSAEQFEKSLQANAATLTVHLLGCEPCIPGRVTGATSVYGQNIDCPPPDPSAPCTASFLTGQTWETLTATPAPGWQLFAWHGCDEVSAGRCRVIAGGANRSIGAEFHLVPGTLIVQVEPRGAAGGSGPGTVTVQPGGESCRATCVFQFSPGEHLTLTATPDPDSSFTGWGGSPDVAGCDSTSGNTCRTTMPPNLNVYVTASFDGPGVSLKKTGTGTGTVTSRPAGIACGPSCPAQRGFFAINGEQVTLTATPAPGSSFAGWNGCDSTAANTCITTARLDTTREITAQFVAAPPLTMIRVAGTGTPCVSAPSCGDGAPATSAQFSFPAGIAVDAAGDIYVADTSDQEIREIGPTGTIARIAGTGSTCSGASCGDGGPATAARLDNPQSVTVDGSGNVYIADTDNEQIRKISPGGTITTIAGVHGVSCQRPPACGDGGPATEAFLNQPLGVAVDAAGSVYIADGGDGEIRKVSADGTITRIAGTGTPCMTAPACGDGGRGTSAMLSTPAGVATDSAGNVYVADSGDDEIRKLAPDGIITRFAGTGAPCTTEPTCTNGPDATHTQLSSPMGVAVGPAPSADVYIADSGDSVVWAVDSFGQINQVAGTGIACITAPMCGDGGPATSAQLGTPQGIALDASGNIDIADTKDHEIRQAQVQRPL